LYENVVEKRNVKESEKYERKEKVKKEREGK
jgi:hypothetical protein